jgi:hypothetical protein
MAKNRIVDTIFWEDHYTANLDPIEKLLFLYCLTNSSTSICGIYQITLKKIAVETGIDKEMVVKVLQRFANDERIFYSEGWLGIRNFIKHQNQGSPKIRAGIDAALQNVPGLMKTMVFGEIKGIDTLSHPNTNANSNSNTNSNAAETSSADLEAVIDAFSEVNPSYKKWFANTTQRAACTRLIETHGLGTVLSVIKLLPRTNTTPYLPSITTPVQLEDKWAQLEAGLRRKKGEIIGKGRGLA